jgi:hypothetical protein
MGLQKTPMPACENQNTKYSLGNDVIESSRSSAREAGPSFAFFLRRHRTGRTFGQFHLMFFRIQWKNSLH